MKIDKKTFIDFCYIINSKLNYSKLNKANKESFKYLENRFFKRLDTTYKLFNKDFNSLCYQIGLYLEEGLYYDEIYFKMGNIEYNIKEVIIRYN